ncbi:hypothetical protein GCM10007874_50820 [Labrys miyagiensis]|uniref:Uncharacterized protein n=1 Tax=Labrys miyagiensis TaxID=346912 RepID=A0ABQ6CQG4_9HYPH|nr:hypothetical protein GCM10007874_50820 [Labrys miyagiensis]
MGYRPPLGAAPLAAARLSERSEENFGETPVHACWGGRAAFSLPAHFAKKFREMLADLAAAID